jgi:hypothetical protein
MTDEENTKLALTNNDEGDDEETDLDDDDEMSIEEEFRGLYADVNKIKERWLRLAKQKEEEKDKSAAQILRLVAGDIIPIISDLIAASGGAFEEMGGMVSEAAGLSEGPNITEDEAVQIYVTLLSNVEAFKRIEATASDSDVKTAFSNLRELTESTMTMLQDTFGDEFVELAVSQLQETAKIAGVTSEKK